MRPSPPAQLAPLQPPPTASPSPPRYIPWLALNYSARPESRARSSFLSLLREPVSPWLALLLSYNADIPNLRLFLASRDFFLALSILLPRFVLTPSARNFTCSCPHCSTFHMGLDKFEGICRGRYSLHQQLCFGEGFKTFHRMNIDVFRSV